MFSILSNTNSTLYDSHVNQSRDLVSNNSRITCYGSLKQDIFWVMSLRIFLSEIIVSVSSYSKQTIYMISTFRHLDYIDVHSRLLISERYYNANRSKSVATSNMLCHFLSFRVHVKTIWKQ